MKRKDVINVVKEVSEGLFESATDILLLSAYLSVTISTARNMYQANRAGEEALRILEKLNYQTIKRVLYKMVANGLIKRVSKEGRREVAITEFGRERIRELIPTYRLKRPWDGHLYLISYDVPREANNARNLLRDHIRKTGGALLQESLWVNPYNPTQILEEFVTEYGIPGSVLVSKLGKDGSIGKEKLSDLISRVYRLHNLGQRYAQFLHDYQKRSTFIKAAISYLSILKDDPQLPFPLEPNDFPAARAYERYVNLIGKKEQEE